MEDSKMKENEFVLEKAINTPNGNEYSSDEHIAIARRTKYYSRHGVVLTRRNYSVGGMTYQVNSFFCPSRCPSADEGLRRLMQQEMVRRNNGWSMDDILSMKNAADFDICVPEQYREYVGGSTYRTGEGFANEYLKVIGETYDGQVYTGELKKVNGTPIVGNKTVAANTMGLVIPACSDPAKYQASWDFISWVATEGQQYVAYMGTVSPVAQDVLFSDKYATNAQLSRGKDFTAMAITAANAGRGDWGFFENGRWVTDWANDFNQNVRRGRKTMSDFLAANAAKGKAALDNMYCIIRGIR